MNSSPATYATTADPKFPPSEEYSHGNYIPDYYATHATAHAAAAAAAAAQQQVVHQHQSSAAVSAAAAAAAYGYHHSLYPSSLSTNDYGHHHHPAQHQSYYNPCPVPPHPSHGHLGHVPSHQQPTAAVQQPTARGPSPLSLSLHRSPSPRSQAMASLADPPSPPDLTGSGSDSEQGANPVIYPWMKKVHVNQGE